MDPLTAIGLVSNILSFIDFSVRLLRGAKEVHDSQHGVLEENRSREAIMREMQRMSTRMLVSGSPEKADEHSSLNVLATECRELSTQLISLLEKIKPKRSGSTTQSLASALRNKIYDSERASLEARLSDCRAQLHLELSNLTRSETLEKLESLVEASKLDETKLDRIESHIAQLRENINFVPSTSEDRPMLMTLLAEEEKVFTTIARDRILNCLSFDGMNRRSNMVVETHSNTYEWILEDEYMAEELSPDDEQDIMVENAPDQPQRSEDVEKVRARDKLRAWLESGSSRDVFHLSGKLGSGKSTLMKHIRGSSRTKEKLDRWAGDTDGRKLTIADFYFWNIGSDYEKSLRGLYTSLLHQILSQCPDLIPKVWPAQWAQANSAPWLIPKTIEITERDIDEALFKIIDSHEVLERHCFAFFIDGLDEFQSTVQHDQGDLVKLLCRWAALESGNIKICVSSREYPVFMDGFTSTLRIRFHDLTRHDMDVYIRDKLQHASAEESFENLVSLIMSKANGVFLWVALVVKSLREGLDDGLSCSDLTQEVDILPDQLESLYKHILMSMGKSKRRKAYQTFSMVMELKKHGDYRMSLLAYSFLEEYEAGENFFMNGDNVFPMSKLTGEHGAKRAESSSRRLAGWCKGLVEPYERPLWNAGPISQGPCMAAWDNWSMELDFVHRSISDFLESDEVQHDMRLNLRRFDHVDAVLNLIVSDLFYENTTSIQNTSRSGTTTCILLKIMECYDLIQAPYIYLQRVRELLAVERTREQISAITRSLMVMSWPPVEEFRYHSIAEWAEPVSETLETVETNVDISSNQVETKEVKYHFISDPLQALMLQGLCDYPLWQITNKPGFLGQPESILTLACFCLSTYGAGESGNPNQTVRKPHRSLDVLEALFKEGRISPNTVTRCRPVMATSFWGLSPGNSSSLTLWHYFLLELVTRRYRPMMHGWFTQKNSDQVSQFHRKALQLFLRFKPETEFSLDISMNEDNPALKRDFLLNFGKQGLVFKFSGQCPPSIVPSEWKLPYLESEVGLPSEDGTLTRRHFSFREFIEISLLDNKEEVLKMLDEQSKPHGDCRPNISTITASVTGKDGGMSDQIKPEDENQRNGGARQEYELANSPGSQNCLETSSQWARYLWRSEYVRYTVAVLTGVILTTLFTYLRERLGRTLSV